MIIKFPTPKWLKAGLKATAIYAFAAWLYVVANIFVFPQWQLTNVSQYIPIPTNVFGISAFATSFMSFFLWEWSK